MVVPSHFGANFIALLESLLILCACSPILSSVKSGQKNAYVPSNANEPNLTFNEKSINGVNHGFACIMSSCPYDDATARSRQVLESAYQYAHGTTPALDTDSGFTLSRAEDLLSVAGLVDGGTTRGFECHLNSYPNPIPFGELEKPHSSHEQEQAVETIISVYLDRIHPSTALFNQDYIRHGLRDHRQRSNIPFKALVYAICAMTLLQAKPSELRLLNIEESAHADFFLEQAIVLHNASEFEDNITLDNVLTCIFFFGCQFCKGQFNAAWLQLQEAINLSKLIGLHDTQSYTGLVAAEADRRMRSFLCLYTLER